MTVKQAIELLLTRMNRLSGMNNAFFGAMDGTVGNINVLQRDMNQAIGDWQTTGNTEGLQRMAATLYAQGKLTEAEHQQIMETLSS